jgi:glycosyltransferase involved in cell wall biosynthesis
MKIALISDSLARGGAERQVLMAAAELQRLGDQVSVIIYHHRIGYDEFIAANGIDICPVGIGKSRLGRVADLADFLRRGEFDVVHGFKDNASFYTRLASLKAPGPTYFCGYRCLVSCSPRYSRLHQIPIARPSGWIVNSAAVKTSVAETINVPDDQIHIVPNGIDLEDWNSSLTPAAAKQRLGIDPRKMVISMVAQVRAVKNHPFMLAVAKRMTARGWDGVLLFAGDGPDLPELRKQTLALGIGEQVRWLGERSDLADLYRASDITVLASESEGLPNVLIEAGAAGVPSVSTDQGGVKDIVVSGETGYLVTAGDEDEMCRVLLDLLGDDTMRHRMGCAARGRVEKMFTAELMGQGLREIYQAVCSC